ncbi:transport system permease protein [Rhodomicrobium vannielii ATCC 17100]|uniref:Transport system permease protein n=1 Tax=Rhodomicrobium vannielii (strain ATCC 17100 / DSM 162 / LMG 4299 / NCIMB 10020 / ATH 3.1.1) TaxID=648757 RepID=E3I4H8_RHOVT|nr:iron ABC transporter permease [Rhodomicrobium vannielii]ADP70493.1 transport system permease protein [Rhodomicrobium vannielii ATCC 17100]
MRRERATDGKAVFRFSTGLEIPTGNLLAASGLLVAAILLAALSTGLGRTDAGISDLVRLFFGREMTDEQVYALWTVRLPRIVMGFMAGWCVALAGAILQSIARNPLADPGLFGLSQGAMTMIMLLAVIAPGAPREFVAFAAMGGGLGVALLLIWLVGGERSSGLSILLMGIAIQTVLSSVDALLLLYTPPETSYALSDWIAGSLFGASWPGIASFAVVFVASLVGIFFAGRALQAYDLGSEMAMALGEPVGRSRPVFLVFAVMLAASAVTAVGPLTFLGVLAPHLAGFISPAVGRPRLLLSGLMGGILVVAADALARSLLGNLPLPIGLSLTLIGVPLFIVTLSVSSRRRRG